jgi:ribosome biogenesis GTPase
MAQNNINNKDFGQAAINLSDIGWNSFFEEAFTPWKGSGLVPGRVVARSGPLYEVLWEDGRGYLPVSGHFDYIAAGAADYPAAGDWVLLRGENESPVIERVLARKTVFARRASGRSSDEQVIASNIDYMFITASVDGGRQFTERGLERYIVMVRTSGALPVIILNKCDLAPADVREDFIIRAESVAGDIPVIMVSALTGEGLDSIKELLRPGTTAAFTGPSGVGKSAIINSLAGDSVQATGETREDDLRGRHTTTRGELFFLKDGGMVIDTPGLRELRPSGGVDAIDAAFDDISEAALICRFTDCRHMDEPGCAVLQQVSEGYIDHARYENYMILRKEVEALEMLRSEKGKSAKKVREKEISKLVKRYNREHRD